MLKYLTPKCVVTKCVRLGVWATRAKRSIPFGEINLLFALAGLVPDITMGGHPMFSQGCGCKITHEFHGISRTCDDALPTEADLPVKGLRIRPHLALPPYPAEFCRWLNTGLFRCTRLHTLVVHAPAEVVQCAPLLSMVNRSSIRHVDLQLPKADMPTSFMDELANATLISLLSCTRVETIKLSFPQPLGIRTALHIAGVMDQLASLNLIEIEARGFDKFAICSLAQYLC